MLFRSVRWTVADEERHEIDREAIKRALSGAADVQLEGRIVPIVRSRAEGISRCPNLAGKVRVWAEATGAKPEPLLADLDRLSQQTPEQIAAKVLARCTAAEPSGTEVPTRGSDVGRSDVRAPETDAASEMEVF